MVLSLKIKAYFIISLLAFAFASAPALAASHMGKHHGRHHAISLVSSTAGYADIVLNADTGQIIHATNPDALRHPASLTKMMTLYLTFQALQNGRLQINQYLPISENAACQSPSKLGLRAGQRIRTEDAILGVVTQSANDAAVVLGEWLGGSEEGFAQMMTRQAKALGMAHTRFNNPSGLPDPGQITTARDMAALGRALIYHFPQFYPYFSHDGFSYAGIFHHNHNHLMDRYDGMDGIKTGYIRASGFNLVSSVKRGNVRLIGVVFGGHSAVMRDNRMAQLLDQAFGSSRVDKPLLRIVQVAPSQIDAQGDSEDEEVKADAKYVAVSLNTRALPATSIVNLSANKTKENTIPGDNWGIQIGAYSDPEIGHQALAGIAASLPQLLGSADPVVQRVSAGNVTMFRARMMMLDQKTAQAACAYLTQQGQGCLTVGP